MGTTLATAPELDRTGRDRPERDRPASPEARIRAATLACVARFGATKTTLDDIARESGVSRATIYRVFPGGRDTLFEAVLAAEVRRFFAGLADNLEDCDELEDLLVTGLGGAMRFLLGHEALRTVVTLEPALLLPQLAFHRLEGVLTLATAFATPYLERHVSHHADAVSGAEHLVRIVLSYALHPDDSFDPYDDSSVRAFVRTHILPGFPARPTSPAPNATQRTTR